MKLTLLEQDLAIAKILGWKRIDWQDRKGRPCVGWKTPDGRELGGYPPSYTGCLNACREMEKSLTKEQANKYGDYLANTPQDGTWVGCTIWHIDAPQRCEAFLRVHGIWQD